ncbi:hypothetical protein ACPC54_34645 [Kitasatospora sp. NPDC094028]
MARSGCGEERCCPALYVTVAREGEYVVWGGWRDPSGRDFDLPSFRFAADGYQAEVRRAEADRAWEWPAVVVAMRLEEELRARGDWLARWECEVEGVWSSRGTPEQISLILRHPAGRGEGDLPWAQFEVVLPIGEDDPLVQADRLQARLTAGDPRVGAELCGGSNPEVLGYPWP